MSFLLLDPADAHGTWQARHGDISLGGLHWRGPDKPLGPTIDVRIQLPGESTEVRAHGQILHIRNQDEVTHVHARFTDLDVRGELAIARFLDEEISKGH